MATYIKDNDYKETKRKSKGAELDKEQAEKNAKSLYYKFGMDKKLVEIETAVKNKDFEAIISFSTKFTFLFKLLRNFRAEGHRVLIFSMSKKNLDMIEEIILSGYLGKDADGDHVKYMRIDGNTEISERESMCNDFNKDTKQFLGLLTTKVGGMGLNLAGADRAIIMDPDWNPANDN